MRHPHYGDPRHVLKAAIAALDLSVLTASRIIETPPLGPSRRRYANAVVLIQTGMDPPELLDHLKALETAFGRRRGQRWAARVLDLDIVLWSGGMWAEDGLTVPHTAFRQRGFVLAPLAQIAGHWRDPVSNLTVRQLKARLDRRRPAA